MSMFFDGTNWIEIDSGFVVPSPGIELIGETTNSAGNSAGTNSVVNFPANQENDILIAFIAATQATVNPPASYTAPSPWTEVMDGIISAASAVGLFVAWRVAPAGGLTTQGFTASFSTGYASIGIVYRGASSVAVVSTLSTGSGTAPVSPAIVTTDPDSMIVRMSSKDDDVETYNGISVGTVQAQVTTGAGNGARMAYADNLQALAGSTGAATWTMSSNAEEWGAITLSLSPNSVTRTLSFSCWLKLDELPSVTGDQMRICGSGDDMEMRVTIADELACDIFGGTAVAPAITLSVDTWYHIVGTGDAVTDENNSYVDGVLNDTEIDATGTNVGSVLHIGETNGGPITERFQGTIDDFRVYNRVLPLDEVKTIHATRGHDGIVHGLVGRWLMREKAAGLFAEDPVLTIGIGVSSSAVGTSTTLNIGAAGNDRLVVVVTGDESSGTSLTGVTVDGNACTLVETADNPDGLGNHQEMWAIQESALGASSGSVTVAITGGDAGWAVTAQVFTNVAAGGPSDSNINQTAVTGPTIPVTGTDVVAGGLVVAGYGQGTSGLTSTYTSPLVERESVDPSSADLFLASGIEVSAQTAKTYTATMSGTYNRGTGIVGTWNPASAGTTDIIVDASNLKNNGTGVNDPEYAESELSTRKRHK